MGGGESAAFAVPSFQSSVSSVVGSWRGTPDVSMSASTAGGAEIYDQWRRQDGSPVGGTSQATPEFAGIVAIADQVAGTGLGDIELALYAMETAGATGIVDVTSGDNSFNGVTGYRAACRATTWPRGSVPATPPTSCPSWWPRRTLWPRREVLPPPAGPVGRNLRW